MKNKKTIVIKYGGNAMLNDKLKKTVAQNLDLLKDQGYRIVLVHGGGPFIKKILGEVQVESEFIGGHRKTTPEALRYVEMALKGEVNGSLVNILNQRGLRAVGLSGKDGNLVIASKRSFIERKDGTVITHDLGQVGDVIKVNTALLELLLENGYLPVVTCLASDEEGNDYNVNADMFAGHLAGALEAEQLLMLTDVDGLREKVEDPLSVIPEISLTQLGDLYGSVIQGGMIPKMEACEVALRNGTKVARIINGTKPQTIFQSIQDQAVGTKITKVETAFEKA
jgi:acetylglutamate kinase